MPFGTGNEGITITVFVQHCVGSGCSKLRKRNKRHKNQEGAEHGGACL